MKVYQEQNVYDACVERINIVFDKFDNVCMSLSGGKDSSTNFQILLHLLTLRAQTKLTATL